MSVNAWREMASISINIKKTLKDIEDNKDNKVKYL